MSEPESPQSVPSPTLDAALAQIDEFLRYLSGGVSFCDDRGFGWTVESEGWRRDFIADHFQILPELRTLLPIMYARLLAGETIADRPPGLREVDEVIARRKSAG